MSTEEYKGFHFRYCWDMEKIDSIRVYVEAKPSALDGLIIPGLLPAQRGIPEHIDFVDKQPSLFPEAQQLAQEWADHVLDKRDSDNQ